jgi:hypothetical protein
MPDDQVDFCTDSILSAANVSSRAECFLNRKFNAAAKFASCQGQDTDGCLRIYQAEIRNGAILKCQIQGG